MKEFNPMLLISVILYTLGVVGIGIWRSRSSEDTSEDYYLAGRSLGPWLSALSGAASAESAWVLLGLVGTAYAGGISALWLIPGCLAGYLFTWLVLGPKLRATAEATKAITIPEVLAARHEDAARMIRIIGSIITLAFMTAYVSAQFSAVGKALDSMFNLSYVPGVFIGLLIVLMYLISGGFRASVWTDFVQALLMVSTLVLLPIGGLLLFDGSLLAALRDEPALFELSGGFAGYALVGFIVGWVGIGLGYPGQPHVLTRIMATKDDQSLRKAGVIAAAWSTTMFTGAILMGLVARAWMPGLTDPEQALPAFAVEFLPAPIAGLVLAAVIAAICSTADSQLLVGSSTFSTLSQDLLQRNFMETRRSRQAAVVALGLVAAVFAATESRVIFDFVLYAWAVLGAGFGPALIGSLFWKKTSGRGVVTGMTGGALTAIVWKNIPALSSTMYELVPAFLVGLILTRFAFQTTVHQDIDVQEEALEE